MADYNHEQHPPEEGTNWTAYAAVKYGLILVIVLAILYFLAIYVLPAL